MSCRMLWKAEALMLAVLVACSGTPRVLRVETGARGEALVHIPRTASVQPVEVADEEVTRTLRRLARDVRLSGTPRETVERLFQLDALDELARQIATPGTELNRLVTHGK